MGRWHLVLATALACAASPGVAHASTFAVDDSGDAVDSAPGNGACLTAGGKCTLRAAVQEADQLAGADTITLPAGTYTRTIGGADGADPAATGDLDITGDLTITGAGQSTTTVDAAGLERGFDVLPGATASISGLTVKNGSATDPVQRSGTHGGGIRVGEQSGGAATATLTDVTVTSNHARLGAGVATDATGSNLTLDRVNVLGNGGGTANEGAGVDEDGGTVTIKNSTVSGNSSNAGAGVTDDGGGTVDIVDSTVSDNHATSRGSTTGGVYETGGGTVTITRSLVSGNTADEAGGVSEDGGGTLNVIDSTIRGNRTTGTDATIGTDAGGLLRDAGGTVKIQGSAIVDNTAGIGAGIFDVGGEGNGGKPAGPFTIVNSTISGNHATTRGGGIHAERGGTMSLNNVTLFGNVADAGAHEIDNCTDLPNCTRVHNIVLSNTIVSGGPACFGPINSSGHNLFGDTTCGTAATGDIVGANPMLSAPADNGGPTFTAAELDGSPAIDHGAPATCAAADQRGVRRPVGVACDIGAFERGLAPPRGVAPPPPPAGGSGAGPRACITTSGFRRASVARSGAQGVRFSFTRKVRRPVSISVFQEAVGGHLTGNRLVAVFRNRSRSFAWTGRANRRHQQVVDGYYEARYRIPTGPGRSEVRRFVLRRSHGRFARRRDDYRRATCQTLRVYWLRHAVFGGRRSGALGVTYRLGATARVGVEVLRGGRVVRSYRTRTQRGGRGYVLGVSPRRLRAGDYSFRITVRRGRERIVASVVARRL